jgi:hypothetical protein
MQLGVDELKGKVSWTRPQGFEKVLNEFVPFVAISARD